MNGKSIYHTRATTDRGTDRQNYRQTEKVPEESRRYVKGTRKGSEHLFSNGTKPRTDSIGRSAHSAARTRVRYIGYRATERVSAFWYALATFDLILAILLWCVVMTDTRALEAPTLRIEHIYKVPVYDSGEHKEMLDTETLLDQSKVYMLAHLIGGEAGADWCTDELQLAVGSVVLNRIASDKFPNTMEEVIFQKGQYSVTWNGAYENEPTERTVANAKYLLINGPTIPEDVLFQANFKQGKHYKTIQGVHFGR